MRRDPYNWRNEKEIFTVPVREGDPKQEDEPNWSGRKSRNEFTVKEPFRETLEGQILMLLGWTRGEGERTMDDVILINDLLT